MSDNLPWTALAENQDHPEIPITEAFGIFDQTLTTMFAVNLASANAIVTEMQSVAKGIIVSGASVAGRTMELPLEIRALFVHSVEANTESLQIKRGTTLVTLTPGSTVLAVTDGTSNGLVCYPLSSSVTKPPIGIGTFAAGILGANEVLIRYIVIESFTIPASATGSYARALDGATSSTTLTLAKNGTDFATINFDAAATSGTFTQDSPTTFTAGDILTLMAPATPDATLAGVSVTLKGNR